MTTSDGITGDDWNRVGELVFAIWHHINDAEVETRRLELFAYLDALETKYGPLPSLLATRADFSSLDDSGKRLALLNRAYALAVERGDRANSLAIAHSLADMYLWNLGKPLEGGIWLTCFRTHLDDDPEDPWWQAEYDRLKAIASKLASPSE